MFAARLDPVEFAILSQYRFANVLAILLTTQHATHMLCRRREDKMEIRNTPVLITGGSRGLGRELGKRLAREGARVVLVARGAEELTAVVNEIRNAGGEAYGIAADIGNKNHIYSIAGEAAALIGAIDILIQNASTLGPVPLRLL